MVVVVVVVVVSVVMVVAKTVKHLVYSRDVASAVMIQNSFRFQISLYFGKVARQNRKTETFLFINT